MRHEAPGMSDRRAILHALAGAALALSLASPARAQGVAGAQMPDPKQMSGVPLPTSDVPAGTLTVRVVRGSLSNLIVDQPVELHGDTTATAKTNDAGRAEFTGLKPGARVKAVVVVDGERVESQEITMPPTAGVRVMLVATDPATAKRSEEDSKLAEGPARTGIVVLGDQSRFVIEPGEDGLTVYNIWQITNTARVPVQPAVPIIFNIPDGAMRPSLLEGSSPLASVAGSQVSVRGPFPPGMTLVQFAYLLPYSGDSGRIVQRIPAALAQLAVVVQKVGAVKLSSPQISEQRDVTAQGETYILGQGPPLPAGTEISLALSGLPHPPVWPRNVAVALAIIVLVTGGYGAFRGKNGAAAERRRLEAERERFFADLAALEESHRNGAVQPRAYAARRREIVAALERIYAALDETAAA
jgi:hypothetical protein